MSESHLRTTVLKYISYDQSNLMALMNGVLTLGGMVKYEGKYPQVLIKSALSHQPFWDDLLLSFEAKSLNGDIC